MVSSSVHSLSSISNMGSVTGGCVFICIYQSMTVLLHYLRFLCDRINNIFLSMTSFHCLQVSFIKSCGKYSPHNFDVKLILFFIIFCLLIKKY